MHAAVRFPAHATYLVPGNVLPPVGIRPVWPGTVRADSSRAHAPHRVADLACMRETESLRRHANVTEPSRRFCSGSTDDRLHRRSPRRVLRAVWLIPPTGLRLHTRLARVERGTEIVHVPISHIGMRKETCNCSTKIGTSASSTDFTSLCLFAQTSTLYRIVFAEQHDAILIDWMNIRAPLHYLAGGPVFSDSS